MKDWIRREWQRFIAAIQHEKERQAAELENKREALKAFAVQFGRVHFHNERWKWHVVDDMDEAQLLIYGQKEAMNIWKHFQQLQILHSIPFIDAFMDGWRQGMEDRF